MIKYDFTGKNVIVTGGAKGLGFAIVTEFAKAGANVVIADLDIEAANSSAQQLKDYNVKLYSYKLDVSNYEEFEKMINKVSLALGSVDILINNAGICKLEPLIDMDVKTLDAIVDIDLKGTLYGVKAVAPQMKKQGGGKIVNLSSIAAKLSGANASVYSCCKAAVISLTASLAREYAKDNINVNCILPGIIRTPLWEQMLVDFAGEDKEKQNQTFKAYTESIPTGRPQEPVDIANAVLFLCSEENINITGQNLGIDGGHTF